MACHKRFSLFLVLSLLGHNFMAAAALIFAEAKLLFRSTAEQRICEPSDRGAGTFNKCLIV